ncbi:dienelactone hydrolase family protein [Chromobacterium alticapitis]|uniref:Alpha/beta hydrolase n=1 Tax=Chromobacterium alticapitis TaxID=2073169 RepID=A0A2S5DFN5_9NEIS|nr:alpha/beta hydrolase [Chromobacterium alticapitis]POZ61896.1 alpha/beta hydrolase [Chromobacterium alticapitis]
MPEFDDLPPPLRQAMLTLPAHACGEPAWAGRLEALPSHVPGPPRPLLLFLHGSSGLNEQTQAYQRWLADTLGLASLAPDSFARPNRPRYQSPAPVAEYEAVHALRLAEIQMALAALPLMPWVDARQLLLAGSSEGGVAVARWRGREFAGRLVYGWSCEDNYFVEQADNGFDPDCALLNVLSDADPFFGRDSEYNRSLDVDGDSRRALAGMPRAKLVLLPQAPHTLYNLPEARALTADFLSSLLA